MGFTYKYFNTIVLLCKMEKSGISSQSNHKSQPNENSQKLNSSAASNSSYQTSSNHQTSKSSFLQKWFGGQSGQQDRDKQISGQQKSGGMSWGEDVHYII